MKDIPAFPVAYGEGRIEGMTLRDYFAAKAMQGDWAAGQAGSFADDARRYYAMADAMLAAREAK